MNQPTCCELYMFLNAVRDYEPGIVGVINEMCMSIIPSRCRWRGGMGSSRGVNFVSAKGRFIASSPDGNGKARIWQFDQARGETVPTKVATLEGAFGACKLASFSECGSFLGLVSDHKYIRIWPVPENEGAPWKPFEVSGGCKVITGHSDMIDSIALEPAAAVTGSKNVILASASFDRTVRIFLCPIKLPAESTSTEGVCLAYLLGHDRGVTSVAFRPLSGHGLLASASADKSIKLWNTSSVDYVSIINQFTSSGLQGGDGTLGAQHQPDLTAIAGKLLVFAAHIEAHASLMGHTDIVNCVSFSPSGDLLASSGECSTIRIWDVASSMCIHIIDGYKNSVYSGVPSVDWSPCGNYIASSGGWDSTLRVWRGAAPYDCLAHLSTVCDCDGCKACLQSTSAAVAAAAASSAGVDATDAGVVEFEAAPVLPIHKDQFAFLWSAQWLPNGQGIVTSGGFQKKTIQLWTH